MPIGTVTFLFTDIEGSTKLWEAHPETMRASLARHDALMREAISASNGYVFKTVGDAFCAAFATAHDALEAAIASQSAISSESWPEETPIKVRMALHTGSAECRDSDYFGATLNRIARILSVGHGGQVLVSAACHELVRDLLPPGAALVDLGTHRLKDLQRPEEIAQLSQEGLAAIFPPLRSLGGVPNNLPLQATSFVGRESELEALRKLLAEYRLVTISGVGGGGKTRLALQLAAETLEVSFEEAWLVELAALEDDALVASTALAALGLPPTPATTDTDTLIRHLKDRKALLVLDNCEHLLAPCARLADAILRTCKDVRIVATSREPLLVPGESTYRIPSLRLPTADARATPDSLAVFEAVRLFVDRAVAAKPEFAVTNENAPHVAELCARLDGIPLAIELAAARLRTMPLEVLLDRLNDRFRLLVGGSRAGLPRQQTLLALVDWSYKLLSPVEQTLLMRLGVFHGGWTAEAAVKVGAGGGVEEWDVLGLLDSLVEKSLVQLRADASRFSMLETIREFALARLAEAGEIEAARAAHATYYHHWLVEVSGGRNALALASAERFAKMGTEIDNLRAYARWGTDHDDLPWADTFSGLYVYFSRRGHDAEGLAWASELLRAKRPADPDRDYIHAALWVGVWWFNLEEYAAAEARLREGIELALAKRFYSIAWNGYYNLSYLCSMFGRLDDAIAAAEAGLGVLHSGGQDLAPESWAVAEGKLIHNRAFAHLLQGDYARAQAAFEKVQHLHDGLENYAETQVCLARCLKEQGGEGWRARLAEGLRIAEESGALYVRWLACLTAIELCLDTDRETASALRRHLDFLESQGFRSYPVFRERAAHLRDALSMESTPTEPPSVEALLQRLEAIG